MRVRLNLDRLKQELSRSNKSQNHWAITLGLSRGHLSEILNGRHPYPSPKTREKLLLGLELAFEDLFELEPETGEWSHESSAAFQKALYGRYILDGEVGEGGMGSVYVARDVKHGRRVAVKVISPEAVSGIGTEQFLKEIRYSAGLQHPHIMPLYDSGESAGYPFFIMPFVDDGSLRDKLARKQRLTVAETLDIVNGVAKALTHAHDARVVHCDIKPENILFAGDHVYLADFGISRAIHAEVRALGRRDGMDTSAGTPAYVSPEQAAGDTTIDARADIYSLACVVFEMLTGHQPFKGSTATEVVARRFATDPPHLRDAVPGLPEALGNVIQRAMAVDRDARYTSVHAFVTALQKSTHEQSASLLVKPASIMANWIWHTQQWGQRATAGTSSARWMTTLTQDLRFAVRSYRKRWARTSVLLATAALGIGINTAVFSIVYAVLLRPLPYPDPNQLVFVDRVSLNTGDIRSLSMASVDDVSRDIESLASVGAYTGTQQSVIVNEVSYRVPAHVTTEDFFDVLQVPPAFGTTRVDQTGAAVAVVSHSFWQRAFAGDSTVLGKSVTVSGNTMPVVGVMPPGFAFPPRTDVWMPQNLRPFWGPSRSAGGLNAIARMTPETNPETVQAELSILARAISAAEPVTFENADLRVRPLQQTLATRSQRTLLLLFAVVGAVLLIACTNIAAVLAADAYSRRGEMLIRRSLGASSGRLARQLLTESLVLGAAGALVAMAIAWTSLQFVNNLIPAEYLHSGAATLDAAVAAFTMVVGLLTGFLFGLAPAIHVVRFGASTESAARKLTPGSRERALGRVLIVSQYALSLAVLVVTSLTIKSLIELLAVNPGFAVDGTVTAELDLTLERYQSVETQTAFRRQLVQEMQTIPGVQRASFVSAPPLVPGANLRLGLYTADETQIATSTDWRTVAPGFFAAIGTPLITGRDFTDDDNPESPGVVIVNQTLARRIWGDANPVGQRIRPEMEFLEVRGPASDRWLTIVGVASTTHHYSLDEEPVPALYMPARQHPWEARTMSLILSVDNTVTNVERTIRDAVARLDPSVPVGRVSTMRGWVTQSASTPRFQAGLLSAFATIALGLVLLGMYGVTSQSLQERRNEMAVRVALGADGGRIVRLLTAEGLKVVGAGQLLGTALILVVTPWLSSLLFNTARFDLAAYLLVSPVLAGAVLLSVYFPARRSGRTDPVQALRV